MIRMILRQIWNERRANALVFLELLVVSVCLFYTADYLYIKYKEYKRPLGFDIGHVYNVELGVVPEGSPDFDTTAVHTSGAVADFLTIIERLSTDPRVESVCYTHNHFHYRYWNQFASFHGIDMQRVGFVRFVDPNYFRVFKVRSFNSQSSESLERAIRENQIVVTGTVAEAYEDEPLALRGQEIWITNQGGGDSVAYRVGAVCEPQRYQEFSSFDYAYYKHLDLSDAELNQAGLDLPRYLFLFIRVKPAADGATFVQDFKKDMEQRLRLGNIYLKEVKPMSYYREEILRTAFDNIRLYAVGALFLLCNVLLGIIGTFWFRTRQRTPEIGLRMAIGASKRSIFLQILLEGLILLMLAFVPAVLIYGNMSYLDVLVATSMRISPFVRFGWSLLFAWLALVVMIVVGIAFPASQAARLRPTEALREE